MRLLGLDVGDARIGVAISDPNGQVAIPLTTLQRRSTETDLAAIAALAGKEEVEALVVGFPLSLNGAVGRQAQRVQDFAHRLQAAVPVPVELWDERFSSVQADELLRRGGPGSRKRRGDQDSLAAAIILQGYLDSKQEMPQPN
ncbi:MAG: Holliday junction resolvase RuvX [Dehalococcoidia bacterium]